jgi:rod shape-determining protein MreC
LSAAWLVRQTQGAALLEAYQLVSRPFQLGPTKEERLTDARVIELQQRLVELESQNQKLKELLDYSKTQKQKGTVAQIAGRSADHWWQQVTLGRGSQEGIKVGFIVMGPGGLVGRVVSVTPNTSRVLLISDATSRVGAAISRSRSMGFMRGQGSNRAVLQFFDKVPDVRRGDVVSTSSVSQLFPPGLPLGRVESVNLDKSPAPEAVIELTAPVSYLEWVVVYPP